MRNFFVFCMVVLLSGCTSNAVMETQPAKSDYKTVVVDKTVIEIRQIIEDYESSCGQLGWAIYVDPFNQTNGYMIIGTREEMAAGDVFYFVAMRQVDNSTEFRTHYTRPHTKSMNELMEISQSPKKCLK